ncbi:MAG: nucleoside-diphosphate kinase [Planctomycetota bacterium]|jgi:nucleoside-diphosphate kinase
MSRLERKGFKLVGCKFVWVCEDLARQLYAVHEGKDFYAPLVRYLSSGPVLVTVWEGERVIKAARKMMGATFGYEAEAGTIRGDFGCSQRYNLVHGSDGAESAEEEIKLFFKPEEIVDYKLSDEE